MAWRLSYPARLFRRFAYPDPGANFERPEDYGLSAEPFTVVTRDRLGIRGWLFRPPAAWGVVIVCHARNASKSRTLGQVRLLWERGLAVAAFDFRGCGDSDAPARQRWGGLWDPLHDVEAVARHVEARVAGDPDLRGRIALFGCSFGGNMALAHAGTAGRHYAALVLDSTPLVHWRDMLDALLARERRDARRHTPRAVVDRLVARSVVWWTRAEPLYRHARRSARNLRRTPVLLVVGERDTLFDIDESRRFLERDYAGPTAVWRVPRGRHLTNHLVDPAAYADRVTRFLTAAFARAQQADSRGSACPSPARPTSSTPSSANASTPSRSPTSTRGSA